MVLKTKKSMTNKELCDLEGILLISMAMATDNGDAQRESVVGMVSKRGKEIVKLCYIDEEGKPFNKIEFPFRMQLLNDMPFILSLIFDEDAIKEGNGGKKPQPMKIQR